jgi:ribosomal protein S25
MSLDAYMKEKLWPILVETVHASVMYPTHKAYTREKILQEKPDITASELANRMSLSLGEALVILHDLAEERKSPA